MSNVPKNKNEEKRRKELKNYEASIFRGLSKNLIHSNKELAALQKEISNMGNASKMNNANKKELERMKKRINTLKKSMSNTTKILEQNKLNTTNIKTIYRDVRNNLKQLLEVLIVALHEKHKAGFMNMRYGGFENEAKKLKKELSKGANNVKDEYTFIGNMTKLFNKIIKFLHKIKPHIEKSLRKDRKGKEASKQVLASRQIGHAYLNIVAYLKSLNLINKNRKINEIKNLNKNVKNKLQSFVNANATNNNAIGLAASMFSQANARARNENITSPAAQRAISLAQKQTRNNKAKKATNIQRIFRGFRNRQKFKVLKNIAKLVKANEIREEDLEKAEKIIKKNNKTKKGYWNKMKKIGWEPGGVMASAFALIAIRQLLNERGISDKVIIRGGSALKREINEKVFKQLNAQRNAQSNQPYPAQDIIPIVDNIIPIVDDMAEGIENIDKKQRSGFCQKVTNRVGEYFGNLWGVVGDVVGAAPGALARTAERAIGYRNQYGQLHNQNGLTTNLLNQQNFVEWQVKPPMNDPEQKQEVTVAEVIKNNQQNNNTQNQRNVSYYINGILYNRSGKPITGGSRTAHIKGVGKRVVRQTKTGRSYVIVNKMKRYLN